MSGCTDRQMVGTMAGSTMGGIFGSSIGGLMGGPRGSDAGTAIGMLAGGVIGNAVASASESRTYDEYEAPRRKSKHGRHGRPRWYSEPPRTTHAPARIEGLSVENIRFIDDNRNQRLDAGEKAKILFEIHNRGNATLYNIAPVIKCYNVKRIAISPDNKQPAPGQGRELYGGNCRVAASERRVCHFHAFIPGRQQHYRIQDIPDTNTGQVTKYPYGRGTKRRVGKSPPARRIFSSLKANGLFAIRICLHDKRRFSYPFRRS